MNDNLSSIFIYLDLFLDRNDFSYEAIQLGRNIYYQKQLANQITNQMNQILSLLSSAINIHLNIGQNLIINTPNVFMSLETISPEAILNKNIQQVGNAQIHLPSKLNSNNNSTILIRVCLDYFILFSIIFFFVF